MNDVLRIAHLKITLQRAFLGRAILIFTFPLITTNLDIFYFDPPGLVCLQEQVTVAEVMARKLPSTLILFSLASFTSSMLSLVLSLNSALWSRSKGAKHCGQPWPQESSRREEGVEVGVYLVHKITVRLKGYKCYKLDCFQNSLYAAFVGFVCEECSNARNIISLSPQPAQAERDADIQDLFLK